MVDVTKPDPESGCSRHWPFHPPQGLAPAYLSDTEAATGVLALLCEVIGEPLDHGLAARRYVMSGSSTAGLPSRLPATATPATRHRHSGTDRSTFDGKQSNFDVRGHGA
ncbi:hypothetical protein [Streptomyces leeuwenhoekii]|uniref:Uncharacterized protein n=1 Tax=Streptomyces leeuwenhoekii TaxID=1437453 RepID=A0A0F7VQ54_STRLW|nr:hypothetical protein [Streptomyces leeuwenhoekii]CQR59522.1 Hypothetical Protein sle_00600 [Streptomyces leeuwenhoekii]